MTNKAEKVTLTGIADEAGQSMALQIAAHEELGWRTLELRQVDGMHAAGKLPDEDFKRAADMLDQAGMRVTAFSSAIGNFSSHITKDFAIDVEELKTAIPRMQRLGVKYIRTMSWRGEGVEEKVWRNEAIRRYRELVKIAADGGIYLAHENCRGWGGLSSAHTLELIDAVDSPHLVVLLDIGNTVTHDLDPWEYYTGVKDLIRYVHVKDARKTPETDNGYTYCYPGEGEARVRDILADLISSSYSGTIAIEPHIKKVIHHNDSKPQPDAMRNAYLKYARMVEKILEEIALNLGQSC